MLPMDPLKIDFKRLAVVFSAAGAVAAPAGREVALSIRDTFSLFLWSAPWRSLPRQLQKVCQMGAG
ncbi:hypothetical protein METHP14_90003 [Pseudomonas sp. P14-2025]